MSELDRLTELTRAGRLSRRQFLDRAAALGVGAAAATSMLGRAASAQTPQKGGDLVLGIDSAGATDSLDPATYTANYMQTVGYQWGNPLVELDESNAVIPELAESWEPNEHATEWVFKLRKGVQFSNGKEMTAADVVYSINHHRGEGSTSGAQGYLQPITDIKATDTHEVTVVLEASNADVPYILSDYHLLIMPEDGDPTAAIGTGAFIIESFEPGVRTFARRNPNYWKEGRGHVDTVETIAINDLTARTSALQTGQVHFVNRIDPKTVALLERAPGMKIYDVPSAGHYTFPMRCDTPPFDNNDVRLALKYAIDRNEVVDKILRGYGKLGNDHPVPEFDPFYNAELPQREYDPDKAAFHLKQSGYSGPLACTSRTRRSPAPWTRPRCFASTPWPPASRSRCSACPRTATGPIPGCKSRSSARTGAGARPPISCCPSPTSRMRRGTRRSGSARTSTSCSPRRAASSTPQSARRSTPSCSAWCRRTAAKSSRCSTTSCSARSTT